jgi:hypothetical protein
MRSRYRPPRGRFFYFRIRPPPFSETKKPSNFSGLICDRLHPTLNNVAKSSTETLLPTQQRGFLLQFQGGVYE